MDKNFISNFLKSSFFTSLGTSSTIVFHFFSIMIMTRYVSRVELGLYFLILAIVQLFKIISGLGLDLTLVKFLSDDNTQVHQHALTSVIVTRLLVLPIIGGIVYLTGNLILPLFGEGLTTYLFYIPILFSLTSFRELFFHLMQGLQQFSKYAVVQVFSAVVKFVLILMFSSQLSLLHLIYIELIMLSVSLIVQIGVIPFRSLGVFSTKINRKLWRSVIMFGLPLYYTSVLTVGYNRSSVLLIGYFLNPASIAAYEVAQKIPDGLLRLFKSFVTVYFPNLSKLFSQGNVKAAQQLISKSLVLFSVGLIFVALFSFLFRQEIVLLIFSENYLDISLAFSLLMLDVYLRVTSNIMGYSLVSAGYPSISARVNTVSIVINLVSSVIMIPKFGFIGAVYSLLIMDAVAQSSYCFYLIRAGIRPNIIESVKPVLILVSIVGIYLLVGLDSLLSRISFLGLYGLMCFLLIKDFRNLLEFVTKFVHKVQVERRPI